jgi:hypothetical protein
MTDPADDLAPMAARLRSSRPAPSGAFVGALRRRIESASAQARAFTHRRVRAHIVVYALAGALLLVLALISAAGTGPLGS